MFKKVNDQCKKGSFYDAFVTLKDIWVNYPKNTKLFEEIKKIKIKYSPKLRTSLTSLEINNYFVLHKKGKTSDVLKLASIPWNETSKLLNV